MLVLVLVISAWLPCTAAPEDKCAKLVQETYRYLQKKDWKSAEKFAIKALMLNPRNAAARRYYAAILTNSNRAADAIEQVQLAQKIDGHNKYDDVLLGDAYLRLNDLPAARKHYEKAAEDAALAAPVGMALSHIYAAERITTKPAQ